MHTIARFLVLWIVLTGPAAAAEPAVPPDLGPWVPWVLHPQDQRPCPVGPGSTTAGAESVGRLCAWPGRLALDLGPTGGSFTQGWQVFAETWVPLPGDAETWPQDLHANDQPQAVVLHNGAPAVKLPAGAHVLTGRFAWSQPPVGLTLPPETGLLSLVLDGASVPFPRLDRGGRLWLGDPARGPDGQNGVEDGERLDLQVFRRIDDDLPLQVSTRLVLDVAGRARQVQLGPVLLPGAIPLRVQSPLPSRLDPDGTLRVQVRPGHWVLEVESHLVGAVDTLSRRPAADPWPAAEIWSFAARPALRQVELSGPTAVDPRQSGVPADWADLPAYRLGAGETLSLVQRRRGNPDPGPDRLTLERDLWLDLAGGAYSMRDRISGQLTRSWRLTAGPPLTLGQVQVDGEPRLITRLLDTDPPGVEVRRGQLDLVAEGRIEAGLDQHRQQLPAAGWGLDFSRIRARLYLPPGWDLLAVAGTDNLPDSWLGRWSLLDLFLVLILALGVGRLWGWGWGLLGLIALVLTWKVPDAPRQVWLHLLAATALLRLVPRGSPGSGLAQVRGLTQWYRRLALLALLLIGLPFLAGQVRTGLYPHLERPEVGLGTNAGPVESLARGAPAGLDAEFETLGDTQSAAETMSTGTYAEGSLRSPARAKLAAAPPGPSAPPLDLPDPDALIQSGLGLPDWQWNRFELTWHGPVGAGETARIWLLSPGWHLVWSLLGGLLVVVLGLRVAGLIGAAEPEPPPAASPPPGRTGRGPAAGEAATTTRDLDQRLPLSIGPALLLLGLLGPGAALLGAGSTTVQAQGLPDPALLEELRSRLLTPPDCLPDCVDLARLDLDATPDWLRLTLTLDAATQVAAAVPGGPGGWLPTQVQLDGAPLDGLRRGSDDQLLVPLPAGRHRLELGGPLAERIQIEIPFPLPPRELQASLNGWTLEGLDAAGRPGLQVRLVRVSGPADGSGAPLDQGALPPLLRVERSLRIGLDWRVETRVQRLSPAEFPVSLPVPLLAGEAVQTPGLVARDGQVLVNLAPGETELTWTSTLEPAPSLRLVAGADSRLSESWSLDLSPRWHLDWRGPAPVHQVSGADRWLPTWRPLPGEALELTLSRPTAVPGPTLTLDRVDLTLTLGRRASEARLGLQLRGTQGGSHPIHLPAGAQPSRFQANGQDLPLPKSGAPLEIPLTPGRQAVLIEWREPQAPGLRVQPALPDLGHPAVNLNLAMRVPADRWVLFTGGPRIGPVVLFWGVLLVLAGLALALGRIRLTPLKAHDWLLLGIGLSLAEIWVLVLVAGWLFALGLRRRLGAETPRWRYNLTQVALLMLTLVAAAGLVSAVSQGLLGTPQMQIMGNGSGGGLLNWYQDRTAGPLPPIWVITVPMWIYRGLMLVWALWLALRLLQWLRWGWEGYSQPVLWRDAEGKDRPGLRQGDSRPAG